MVDIPRTLGALLVGGLVASTYVIISVRRLPKHKYFQVLRNRNRPKFCVFQILSYRSSRRQNLGKPTHLFSGLL